MIVVNIVQMNPRENGSFSVSLAQKEVQTGIHLVHLWAQKGDGPSAVLCYQTITPMNAREIAAALNLYADISDRQQEASRRAGGGSGGGG